MKHKDHIGTELRRELGITQRALALEMGVPQSTVFRWEKGIVAPNSRNTKAIQDFAQSRGADFQLFAVPKEAPSPIPSENALGEATLRLAKAQIVFCATLEKFRGTDPGREAWEILGPRVRTQRQRLAQLLEASEDAEHSTGFWRAVSALKIFTWRPEPASEEESYVQPQQVSRK